MEKSAQAYRAFDFPNITVGVFVVQMIASDTIKVETFQNVIADAV